jgi:hypothetical protein
VKSSLTLVVLSFLLLLSVNPAVAQMTSSTPDGRANGPAATPCNQDSASVPAPRDLHPAHPIADSDAFTTAYNYLVTFYPRWFTYNQSGHGPCNQLLGPDRISPIYQTVVAINDDTFYASAFVGVEKEPVIVTVPDVAGVSYSVLQLDGYGNVFKGIPSGKPGVYALIGPGWTGFLPAPISPVQVPYNYTVLIFRADKYANGKDTRQEADEFRRNLHAAYLSDYLSDPGSGIATILPEAAFALPYKTAAVHLIANHPLAFLRRLQTAVLAGTTQPMTSDEQALSDTFNALFSDPSQYPQLIAGAQAAHADIDNNYLSTTIAGTSWITFTDIGEWEKTSQGYLNRSSITDYIQYGNNHKAAAYYHAFRDSNGNPLDGSAHSYVLTFQQGQQPDVSRFWSVTAYLPVSIELVPNTAKKYVVASYTPGLVTAPDGSVSIVISVNKPSGVPQANWLPIPRGPVNIMLRAYGPEGTVEDNSYVPPPIEPLEN